MTDKVHLKDLLADQLRTELDYKNPTLTKTSFSQTLRTSIIVLRIFGDVHGPEEWLIQNTIA
jgi:hypothetical protein